MNEKDEKKEAGKVVPFPGDNGDAGEKHPEGGVEPETEFKDGSPTEITKCRTAVLLMINLNGQLLFTADVPLELEKKADMNDIEIMLIQALESVRQQRQLAGIREMVRRELQGSAPHLADHIVNCLHKKAVETANAGSGLVIPKH